MELTEVVQKVQLIEGQFTPSEAKDLISSLISEKINFHKIQRLGQVIHDENCDTKYSEERIMDLITERKIAKEFITKSKVKGRNIKIDCVLKITYDEEVG